MKIQVGLWVFATHLGCEDSGKPVDVVLAIQAMRTHIDLWVSSTHLDLEDSVWPQGCL